MAEPDASPGQISTDGSEGYYALDSEWCFIELDSAAEEHFGRSAHELIGQNIWAETGRTPDSPVYARFHEAVAQRRRVRFDVESGVRPGRWFELYLHPRSVGGLAVFFHEVTQRKRALEALQESEERLRRIHDVFKGIIDSATDTVAAVDNDFRYLAFNEAYRREVHTIYGVDPEIGSSLRDVLAELPEDLNQAIDLFAHGLRGETVRVVQPYGDPGLARRCYELTVRPLRGAEGTIIGAAHIGRDISERKQAEEVLRNNQEALRRTSERLRIALSAARFGTFDFDIRTGAVSWDDQMKAIRGVSPNDSLNYESILHRVHTEDRDRVSKAFLESLNPTGDGSYAADYRIVWPDGSVHWTSARGYVYFEGCGADRHAVSMIGIEQDVTDRKHAERALRESEERFRVAQDLSPDGFLIFRPLRDERGAVTDFLWVYENDAAARMNDTKPKEVCGKRVSEVLPHHDESPFHRTYKEVAETGEVRVVEEASYDQDTFQQRRWFRVAAVPTAGGDVAVLVQNVTERKKAEAALQAHNELLATVFEHMPAAINVIRGSDLRLIMANPGYRAIAPGKGDPVGKTLDELWPETGKDFASLCRRVLETGEPYHAVDDLNMIRRSPDGPLQPAWFTWSLFPIRLPGDEGLGIFNPAWETTERRQAEESLRRSNAALEEADRRKDEFIALLSHELRNPLAPVRYAVPILQSQDLDDSGSRAIVVIRRQTDHLTRLLDDLLDIGRITSGKLVLRRERVTLRSVVEAAIEAATPALSAAHHLLNVDVTPDRVWLNADPARLSQVLTNLLDNSAKFTPGGGEIRLEAKQQDDHAVIRVRDTGIGIPLETLPHVFEMFRQAANPGGSDGGLGIGLAIAKQLVEMHGGTIEAFSAGLGKGAEFVVRLPSAPQGEMGERITLSEKGQRPHGRRLKVLIVDDNLDLVEMLAIVIEGAGHEVRKAFDGPGAVSAGLTYRPDVILLDLGLPVMNGIEVAKELKRNPSVAHARLVALTGWGQAEDRERTRAAGFHHHLTKPTDPEQLQQLLEAIATGSAS